MKSLFLLFKQNLGSDLRAQLPILPYAVVLNTLFAMVAAPGEVGELSDSWRLSFKILGLLLTLLLSVILTLMMVWARKPQRTGLGLHFKKYFSQTIIEFLRTLPSILGYSLLLIIPGIIRTAQFLFVPFVVQRSQAYQQGQVDALKESLNLARPTLVSMTLLYVVVQVVVASIELGAPALLDRFFELNPISSALTYVLLLSNISLLINLWCLSFFLTVFEARMKETNRELAF